MTTLAVFGGTGRMHESYICYKLLAPVPDTVHAYFPLHHARYGELRHQLQQERLLCTVGKMHVLCRVVHIV